MHVSGGTNWNDYLLNLEIPCINLNEFVYDKDSLLNSLEFHVTILEESDLEKNVYFLAGHSGNGSSSYFNELISLKDGDMIFIRTRTKELCFVVEKCYFIEKNGYLEVDNELFNVLFMITCSLEFPDKQLVVRAKLVNV